MDTVFRQAPNATKRTLMLHRAFQTILDAQATQASASFKPMRDLPDDHRWHLRVKQRTVTVFSPPRGEDGAYLIAIDGEPRPLLQRGIDRFAQQYRFHRTSEPEAPLSFTIEWQGDDGMGDALLAAYFIQLVVQLLHTLPELQNAR